MVNIETLKQKLKSLANAIRGKTGKTGDLSLDDMFTEINNLPIGIKAEISYGNTLKNKLESIAAAVRAKTLHTDSLSLDEMIDKIENLVLEGTVTPSSNIEIGTRNLVTRRGNLVTVDVEFNPKQTLISGDHLFTLPHGWKPKETITFMVQYPNWMFPSKFFEDECYLNLNGQAILNSGDVSIYTYEKPVSCNFEFEAI